MKARQIDILKQPILTLLATFALLMTVQSLRALHFPRPAENVANTLSPVGSWIDGAMSGTVGLIATLLAILLASVIITRIISRYTLSTIRSLMPMVLFVICVCGVLMPIDSPALMLTLLMIVHSTELMIRSFKRTEQFGDVMTGSFWVGMAALIVPDLIYVAILLPFQWILWQRSPREMVAGFLLFLLPLLPASFLWWMDGKEFGWFAIEWFESISPITIVDFNSLYISLGGLIPSTLGGLISLLTIASIAVYFNSLGTMRTRARKGHLFFTLLYLVGLAMLLIGIPAGVATLIMGYASVPLIHTFFARRTGIASAIVYLLILLLTIFTTAAPQIGI